MRQRLYLVPFFCSPSLFESHCPSPKDLHFKNQCKIEVTPIFLYYFGNPGVGVEMEVEY